jgi:hypothetical protein
VRRDADICREGVDRTQHRVEADRVVQIEGVLGAGQLEIHERTTQAAITKGRSLACMPSRQYSCPSLQLRGAGATAATVTIAGSASPLMFPMDTTFLRTIWVR